MKAAARALATLAFLAALALTGMVVHARYFAPPIQPPPLASPAERIDRILVEKSARRLTVYQGDTALRSYPIRLGFSPEGDKEREGDGRTPEGIFRIDRRNGASAFFLSLGIDYPRPEDRARAQAAGVSPGGDIFLHGQPDGLGRFVTLPWDWTAGCIALSDNAIEEIWRLAPVGTVVEIRP